MNYKEFTDEYTKLYKYFYESEPRTSRVEEYFKLLKYLPLNKFKILCEEIRNTENDLPRNPVAWINKYLDKENEKKLAERLNNQGFKSDKKEDNHCFACCNGWVLTTSGAKYCLCKKGQRLKQLGNPKDHIATATFDECKTAALDAGGFFGVNSTRIDEEVPF